MAAATELPTTPGGAPQRSVMLPKQELLEGCRDPQGIKTLLELSETVLRTWQPVWSPFLSAPLREEAVGRLLDLAELQVHSDGGRQGAERQRLLISRRCEVNDVLERHPLPVMGLEVEGNFLFDPLEPEDMRTAIASLGISDGEIGDIWIRGDRGAQALCTPEAAAALNGKTSHVREVEIQMEQRGVEMLQLPSIRTTKRFTSVEASCRLDAIASAGFGISRARVLQQIRSGRLRLNWQAVRLASKSLSSGDRLQLQDRGSLEVLSLELTKRDRWRVTMERS